MLESNLNPDIHSTTLVARFPPWFFALAGAAIYPSLFAIFPGIIQAYSGHESVVMQVLLSGCAVTVMLVAASIPFVSIWALAKIHNNDVPNAPSIRRMLHLTFAVSPFYTLYLQLIGMTGFGQWHTPIWIAAAIITGLVLTRGTKKAQSQNQSEFGGSWLRAIHGGIAILVLFGFLLLHLINHGAAIWSAELHETIMGLFRLWYRSEWVEPVLLTLLAGMVVTGVLMVMRYTKSDADLFRNLQTTSGIYLATFLSAHLMAVLGARAANVETDWIFAVGANGLIKGFSPLIPYYILSVFFIITHLSLGLRIVLLSHNVSVAKANRAFYCLVAAGTLATILIATALLGIQIGSS